MSKKILKRSLALGALMAFVITGSAYAENRTGDVASGWTLTGDYTANGIFDVYNGGDSDPKYPREGRAWNLEKHTLKVTGVNSWSNSKAAINIHNPEFTGKEGSVLQISNVDGSALEGKGVSGFGTIDVDKLIVNVTDVAIYRSDNATDVIHNINANVIDLTSTSDNGIYLEGKHSKLTLNAVDILKINAYKDGIKVNSGNSATVTAGELYITATNEGRGAITTVEGGENVNVTATKKAIINGDIMVKEGSTASLAMNTADSVFTGAVIGYKESADKAGNANLTLNGGATWNVTDKSKVSTLAGNEANIVVSNVEEEQVTIGTDNTTKLTVAASADATGLTGNVEEDLEAVSNSVVTGTGENKKAAANTAKITGGSVYEEVSAAIDESGQLGEVNKVVDVGNIAANDMAAVGLMSWRAEMNDMNKRMGELRNANGEHGVWVRMVRGESEYNSVKNQYNQYQLGYDEKLSVDKRWTVGVALSYTDAENNFAQGNGESTNKALSIYGSKLNADGTFVDLIAKYARLENEFDIVSGMGAAEYDANGYSFSAEFGKRIQQGKGMWIEPQVELTYGKVGSADYVTANGVKVAQDSMESLVGRIGFSLGKDIEKGNVYARASYLYDFEGETQATLNNDAVLKQDLGGGWWEVGVGANINLSKATYIYADIEKTFGGEVDTNWQWNLGVRYSF
ncbi:MAG: autotransporter outer membrane beta-barrel domain-containing protein [Phascolarctobacterium sp.]|nr:autotransporter outer membrane beta-barrel domain-containing protein [Phascolarctobacterium sp.]